MFNKFILVTYYIFAFPDLKYAGSAAVRSSMIAEVTIYSWEYLQYSWEYLQYLGYILHDPHSFVRVGSTVSVQTVTFHCFQYSYYVYTRAYTIIVTVVQCVVYIYYVYRSVHCLCLVNNGPLMYIRVNAFGEDTVP